MSDQGISQGWNDGTYRPDMSISRAVMATFLYRYAHRS
ncbi:S-layer homology domain-containing protein [Kocuria rosea]|nr:S-layer homology domain-containing protein [Kocuria rosea]